MLGELASLTGTVVGAALLGVVLGFCAVKTIMYGALPFVLNAWLARWLGGDILQLWLDVERQVFKVDELVFLPLLEYVLQPPALPPGELVIWYAGTFTAYSLLAIGGTFGGYAALHVPVLSLFL